MKRNQIDKMRSIFIQVEGEERTRERTKCVSGGSEVELGTKNCVSAVSERVV